MKANGGAREWTEYYAAQDLRGAAGAEKLHTLHSPDYHGVAIPSVEEWLNTEKIGSGDSSLYDEVDAFLEELADRTPTEEELMHSADGWGALEELRTGKQLVPGALFPKDPAPLLSNHDTKPWYELVTTGTFSKESLNSHPTSFQTSDGWLALLEKSASDHGGTWLHYLHIGIGYMDRAIHPGDALFNSSAAMFQKSLDLKKTAEALRNLAIVAHGEGHHNTAFSNYVAALKIATKGSDADPEGQQLLVRDLSAESSYQFALLGMTNCTDVFTNTGNDAIVPEYARKTDRWRYAQVANAYGNKRWDEFFMLCDCSKERLWPAIGWWGGGTMKLLAWYEEAVLQRATAVAGHPLSQVEKNGVIRANPVPFCLRAVGH